MLRIRLLNLDEQKEFVRICSGYDVDITLHKGNIHIDAKSLLGVTSMDTKFDCYITVGTDNPAIIESLESALSNYSYE